MQTLIATIEESLRIADEGKRARRAGGAGAGADRERAAHGVGLGQRAHA